MRILAIAGECLASLERFDVNLAQGELAGAGLVAICGPTGAGKSTLLDAMCLALYDRTPRLSTDSLGVVQKSAVKAMAQVDFRDSRGERWRAIWRARRAHGKPSGDWQPTRLELHNLDTGRDHSSHKKRETLQAIEEKVGLGFEQFCRSVLLAQGDFARFLHETGRERARLLETITGGEIYSELSQQTFLHHKAARERLEQLVAESAQSRMLSDEELATLRRQRQDELVSRARLERQRDGYQALFEHLRELAEREREVAGAERDLQTATEAVEQTATVRALLVRWQQAERLRPLLIAEEEAAEAERGAGAAVISAAVGRGEAMAAIETARQAERQRDGEYAQAREAWAAAQPVLQDARAVDQRRQAAAQAQAGAQAALAASKKVLSEHEQALAAQREGVRRADALGQQARAYLESHLELAAIQAEQQGLLRELEALVREQAEVVTLTEHLQARQPVVHESHEALALAQREQASANAARQAAQAALAGEQEKLRSLTAAAGLQQELSLLAQVRGRFDVASRILSAHAERAQRIQQESQQRAQGEQLAVAQEAAAQDDAEELLRLGEQSVNTTKALARQDLAARRHELLTPGDPCPLCGSVEHPQAEAPSLSAELLQAELAAIATSLAAARRREREAVTAAAAARARVAAVAAQLTRLQKERAHDTAELQALASELARLGEELAAAQSPLMLSPLELDSPTGNANLEALLPQVSARVAELTRLQTVYAAQQARVTELQAGCDREQRRWEALGERVARLQQTHATLEQERLRLCEKQALASEQVQQLQRTAAAQLGDHAPWLALLASEPQELRRSLHTQLGEYAAQQQAAERAARALEAATAEVRIAEASLAHAQALCHERAAAQAQLAQTLAELTAERTRLVAALRPRDPEGELEAIAAALAESSEQAARARQAAAEARVMAEQKAAMAAQALEHTQRQQQAAQQALSGRRSTLAMALLEAGFGDREEARSLLAAPSAQRETEQALVAERDRALVAARSRHEDRAQRLHKQRAQDLTPWLDAVAAADGSAPTLTADAVEQGRERAKTELQQVAERLYLLELQLHEDEQRRVEAAQQQAAQAAQADLVKEWALLNELIGSADGAKFRAFAQSLTLETLLVHTNEHLRRLRPRYSLRRRSELLESPEDLKTAAKGDAAGRSQRLLDLEIVDHDMGAQVRDCATLSGGESFLVSLALALGLSSLSARNVRVESLFIDEGFGSLDRDTLDGALAVLEELQAHGQQIAIISHITELSERIAHRVLVEPQRAGRSVVRIQVGDLVPGVRHRHARVA